MSRELRRITVSFTTDKPERLPTKNGEQMYADDVADELLEALRAALEAWYEASGRDLLACEPDIF